MKKTYIAPAIQVVKVSAEQVVCASETLQTQGNYNSQVKLGKDRGDYEPEDDISFGDLW